MHIGQIYIAHNFPLTTLQSICIQLHTAMIIGRDDIEFHALFPSQDNIYTLFTNKTCTNYIGI